jgi:hypothetical protein
MSDAQYPSDVGGGVDVDCVERNAGVLLHELVEDARYNLENCA